MDGERPAFTDILKNTTAEQYSESLFLAIAILKKKQRRRRMGC